MLRIPIGYWAIDLLDYEPYVSGQYPYLIQAVQWARELGISVMISMHGAPGSQNGALTSGLIGPVLFATNTSNIDRTLNVLKNLTTEFSRDVYGGTVVSIELLNEPGLFTNDFIMAQLQQFYTQATTLIHGINSTMNVVLAGKLHHQDTRVASQTSHADSTCNRRRLLWPCLVGQLQSRAVSVHGVYGSRRPPILRLPATGRSRPERNY